MSEGKEVAKAITLAPAFLFLAARYEVCPRDSRFGFSEWSAVSDRMGCCTVNSSQS